MSVSPSRRRLLQALLAAPAAAALPACTATHRARPAPVSPDVALRSAAITQERALLDRYRSASVSSPVLAARVAAVLADHEQHLVALGAPAAPPTPAASGGPSSSPSASAGQPPAPAGLAQAERAAAAAHAAAALDASPELAALLASLAACEASHVVALT